MNKAVKHHYYGVCSYESRTAIEMAVEKLKNHGDLLHLGVDVGNERKNINPVRDENGELIRFFERFEMNLQK